MSEKHGKFPSPSRNLSKKAAPIRIGRPIRGLTVHNGLQIKGYEYGLQTVEE